MAISTVYGHVSRALDFFKHESLYFCIGRTTPWDDETIPPAPDVNTQDVEEAVAFKKVLEKKMVVPDPAGTIFYMGNMYREITSDQAEAEKCRWVFVSTTLSGSEVPLASFRQVGLYSGLKPKDTVTPGKIALLPNEVDDTGLLEVLDNRKVTHRQEDQGEKLSLVIEF
ncbi:hypothetical protein D1872_50490 [compost metagenome]